MNMGSTPWKRGTMRATGDVSFAEWTSTDVSVLFPIIEVLALAAGEAQHTKEYFQK